MWDLQSLSSQKFNSMFPTLLRPIQSLFYQTTVCCHPLSVHSINMAHCAERLLVWRSKDGKWRTVVVGQNDVNWVMELNLYTCVWTFNCVFIYWAQNVIKHFVLLKKIGTDFFAKLWKYIVPNFQLYTACNTSLSCCTAAIDITKADIFTD